MKILSILSDNDSGVSDLDRASLCVQSCDLVAVRGCTEFQPEWFQVLEKIITKKPVLPVGQLTSTGSDDDDDNHDDNNETWLWIKAWLDKQAPGSVVYVAFGSEMKPSQEEVTEIALGLEKSNLPFFGVLIAQHGPSDQVVSRLLETIGRGVVYTTWVPQLKILGHEAIGGFLTHGGRSSVVEAVQNEKPLIMLPLLVDQAVHAWVLEEKKMGHLVAIDERDGSFTIESVANSVRLVMVKEEGRIYREKIKEMKDLFVNKERRERYIDNLRSFLKTHRNPKHVSGNS